MAQLKQTAAVTNASAAVVMPGNFAAQILANYIFMVTGELVPYTVAANATFDGTNTNFTLTGNYAGATNTTAAGVVVTDYTYPDSIPTIAQGDVGTAAVFTKAMYKIQGAQAAKAPTASPSFTGVASFASRVLINGAVDDTVNSLQVNGIGKFSTYATIGSGTSAFYADNVNSAVRGISATGGVYLQNNLGTVNFAFFAAGAASITGNLSTSGRVLIAGATDDGVNALQVSGNIALSGGLVSKGDIGITLAASAVYLSGYPGSPSVRLVDHTRTANNKICDLISSVGVLQGRFVNDAYTAAINWLSVTGGYAAGVSSVALSGRVLLGGIVDDGVSTLQVNGSAVIKNVLTVDSSANNPGSIAYFKNTGSNGAQLRLTGNGTNGTNGSKTIRAVGDVFDIVNSAYTAAIFSITDAGLMTVLGRVLVNSPADDGVTALQVNGSSRYGTVANQGYSILTPGDGSHSGYLQFLSFSGARQGYLGYSATNTGTDTGTLNYVAGAHAFSGVLSATKSIQSTANSATDWCIDLASSGAVPNYIAMAPAGVFNYAAGSGLLFVHNDSTGDLGVFVAYAGVVSKIAGPATMVSGAPAAGQIGVAYSAAAGKYTVTNGYATTQNLFISGIRTRTAS